MPTIANAPSGENTSLTGAEKFPLSGSQFATIDTNMAFVLASVVTHNGNVVVYEGEIVWT